MTEYLAVQIGGALALGLTLRYAAQLVGAVWALAFAMVGSVL